ncbi:tRNA lysidine(34) synthetase TilS [Oceanisphaera pacifica]|uniref:tRNA(Ile)-lysidine synthase n=1 Tax=Oceanisphaera pacifica TaxID=2818389 RepID=A0ABS3NGQ6_9GAMM|nr:tRNA lysidine(34) synthetase TilS [Oceanisphaera pacifica]MBO1519773.1 tRNA lysidine(34) synthetase TilS [Oceanisphaera pacifica]
MDLYSVFSRQMSGLTPKHALVVGFSGGLDSTVLLALAARLAKEQGVSLRAIYIAHGLQAAADDWPAHCAQVANALGVSCQTITVQVQLGPRVSLEAAARSARYQAFSERLAANEILLTGHHLDDQAETLLLALKRGAGVAGLAAMPVKKNIGHAQQWRPLLSCSRSQLEAYAHEQGLDWVEDPSNSDNAFDRNFLRNRIMPILTQKWPSVTTTLARSAELCAEQADLAEEIAEQDLAQLLNNQGGLLVAGLQLLSTARRQNALRYWLHRQGLYPSRRQLQAIWQELALARADASPQVRIGQQTVQRYQGALYVPITAAEPIELPRLVAEQWLDAGVGQLKISWVPEHADLAADVEIDSLQLVFNRSGLRAQPTGRAGSRPLKKLWQEYAIAPWQRASMGLVMQGDSLVAVAGLFTCQAYQAKPNQAGWKIEWQRPAPLRGAVS